MRVFIKNDTPDIDQQFVQNVLCTLLVSPRVRSIIKLWLGNNEEMYLISETLC